MKTASTFIFIITILNFIYENPLQGQVVDTPLSNVYFEDVSDYLAIRMYTLTKFNKLRIVDGNSVLEHRPNSPTGIGVGFNFKSLGLAIGIGIPNSQKSNDKYVKTKRFDVQSSVYGKKIALDGFLQVYKGYFNINPEDFIEWNRTDFPKLNDMNVLSLGITGQYIFNAEKYSYKAAFVRNQIQVKSAGSFIAGAFFYYDDVRTENGFVPQEFPDSIKTQFDLFEFRSISAGLSIGYMHTFVMGKSFFFNFAIVPGAGVKWISALDNQSVKGKDFEIAPQLFGRVAFGYEHKSFYLGATASGILRNFEYQQFEVDLSTNQFRIFIGKRFKV